MTQTSELLWEGAYDLKRSFASGTILLEFITSNKHIPHAGEDITMFSLILK